MPFTRITTAGAGTMGSQVGWQMAFHGKHVTVYDALPAGLEKGKAFHRPSPSLGSSEPVDCRTRSSADRRSALRRSRGARAHAAREA